MIETLDIEGGERIVQDGETGITVRDEFVPLVALADRFGTSLALTSVETTGVPAEQVEYVAIVEAGGRRAGLLVDALVAQQDIVVKPFDTVQGSAPWFSGATILGDGSPALIVDVSSVL